ncbi:MAG: hypothetical protein HOK60_00235 [Planctomycetes bacterium]|nr:hypothetical protein [Planctomycetota bacterium]MBT6785014.1 hypothetical protein [Planctomycetota bacterium]
MLEADRFGGGVEAAGGDSGAAAAGFSCRGFLLAGFAAAGERGFASGSGARLESV